jgi:phosphoglycolate phosphatase-like HAD superfamily hydrolase
MKAVAIDLDGALGDTRPLWREWLADVARRARVDEELPEDPAAAEVRLDELVGNWRVLLERYAEEHAPLHLRPSAEAAEALRRFEAAGVAIGAFTASPEPLARVALAQLGASRRVASLETGPGALERLLARLGPETRVLRTRADLTRPD